jgi:hypothetical protein
MIGLSEDLTIDNTDYNDITDITIYFSCHLRTWGCIDASRLEGG